MIQNVNPQQQMYLQPNGMQIAQNYPAQLPIPCVAPCPALQPGVIPVYNNIPYNPVYGNYGQSQQCQHPLQYAPKISTVSIEMNGLEPPKVPGFNDFMGQQPFYQGMPLGKLKKNFF